jgi:hypothetical protein
MAGVDPWVTTVYSVRTNSAGDVVFAWTSESQAMDGYQTTDGGFVVRSVARAEGQEQESVLKATPVTLPLSSTTGLYDAACRTTGHAAGSSVTLRTDWNGTLHAYATNDSIYVTLILRNSTGGSTGLLAKSALSPGGRFNLSDRAGDTDMRYESLAGKVVAGQISAYWFDHREDGTWFDCDLVAKRR